MKAKLIVRLDDEKFPGNGGMVIGYALYPSEISRFHDKDGCVPSNIRIWEGLAAVGTKVVLDGR